MNQSIGLNRRGEIQPHAELLELNRDCRQLHRLRPSIAQPDKEIVRPPRNDASLPDAVSKFGSAKNLQNVLRLQSLNRRGQIDVWPENEKVQQVAQVESAGGHGR